MLFNRSSGTYHNTGDLYRETVYAQRTNIPGQVVSGRRTDPMKVTQTSTITFNLGDVFNGWQNTGFAVPPYAQHLSLRLRLASPPPTKFKVRYISSC